MSETIEIHGASKEAAPSEDKVPAPLWASPGMREVLAEKRQPTRPPETIEIHPAANLIRGMTDEELASLSEDIRINGLCEPIKLVDGKIIDGRHRQRACDELGVVASYEDIETDGPQAYVLSCNVMRRHLSTLEKARLANVEATQKPGGDRKSKNDHSAIMPNGLTQEEAAKKYGVTVRTMRHVKRIDEAKAKGKHLDVIERLENEDISISAAYDLIRTPSAKQRLPSTGSTEWFTPAEIVEAARATMGSIDLDPASCEAANEIVNATRFFTHDDDVLNQEWEGACVWMNPPYGHPICSQLIDKLLDSPRVEQAIVLCQDSTDTGWWQKLASRSAVFGFAKRRINFIPGNGNKKQGSPPGGSTLFGIGVDRERFRDHFGRLCHFHDVGERISQQVNAIERSGDEQSVVAAEKGEFGSGQAAKKLAARRSRKERDLEAKRDRQERSELPATDGFEIYECRCADLTKKVHAESVDLIVTDPPYGKEYLPCWSELAEFAIHALKPGGQLLALSGQFSLPEVYDRLRVDGLIYRWTLFLQGSGGSSYTCHPRQIQSDCKPIVLFEKPGERRLGGHYPHDVIRTTAPDSVSKKRHKWGQDEGAFRDLLGKFADPGMMVCDPVRGRWDYGGRGA